MTEHIAVHKCTQHLLYNKSGDILQLFLSSRERITTGQYNFTTRMKRHCISNSHFIVFVLHCHLHKAAAPLNLFGT